MVKQASFAQVVCVRQPIGHQLKYYLEFDVESALIKAMLVFVLNNLQQQLKIIIFSMF